MENNNLLDKRLYRLLIFFIAVVVGGYAIILITRVNDKTGQLLSDVFEKSSDKAQEIELKYLHKKVTEREKEMQWFESNKNSIDSLLHPQKILLGAHDNECNENFDCLFRLESSLNTTFPLVQLYVAWGDKPEERFPQNKVKNILNMESLPVITWEPWLNDFNKNDYPDVDPYKDRNKKGLQDIADGFYDAYVVRWAKDLKASKFPVFLRFGHEMNDPYRYAWGPQNGNTPEDYIRAWQHVYNVFKREGVENVLWLWSPHLSYKGYDKYYPGDDYVDYVAVNILNYGTASPTTHWMTFDDLFKTHYDKLRQYGKPIMISELGTLDYGGNKSKWFKEALEDMPEKYPDVKSVLFFHVSYDKDMFGVLNWYFSNDTSCVRAISNSIAAWDELRIEN